MIDYIYRNDQTMKELPNFHEKILQSNLVRRNFLVTLKFSLSLWSKLTNWSQETVPYHQFDCTIQIGMSVFYDQVSTRTMVNQRKNWCILQSLVEIFKFFSMKTKRSGCQIRHLENLVGPFSPDQPRSKYNTVGPSNCWLHNFFSVPSVQTSMGLFLPINKDHYWASTHKQHSYPRPFFSLSRVYLA